MKLRRVCDIIPDLECDRCPYEGLSDPDFCPRFSSVTVALEAIGDMQIRASGVEVNLKNARYNEEKGV